MQMKGSFGFSCILIRKRMLANFVFLFLNKNTHKIKSEFTSHNSQTKNFKENLEGCARKFWPTKHNPPNFYIFIFLIFNFFSLFRLRIQLQFFFFFSEFFKRERGARYHLRVPTKCHKQSKQY